MAKSLVAFLALVASATSSVAGMPHEMALTRDWINSCDPQMISRGAPSVSPDQCRARILGEVDGVIAGMKLSKRRPWICMPAQAQWPEKFAVVKKYVNEHPEAMSVDLGDVVAAALANAYPCP